MEKSRFSTCHLVVKMILCVVVFLGLGSVSWAESVDRETLELKVGGSDVIETNHTFRRVSIAKPGIADVVALSPRNLYVFGKKVGYTSIMLWEENAGRTLVDLVVSLDLTALKQKLHELYPTQEIGVYSSENGIVLTGTVTGPEVVEQVIRLAESYLPKLVEEEGGAELQKKGETGKSGQELRITNLLKVGGNQQVMLEVKFAEVTRNSSKDWQAALGIGKLGNDFIGAAGVNGVTQSLVGDLPAMLPGGLAGTAIDGTANGLVQRTNSLLLNFAENPANIFVNIDNVTTALNFLETEGLARLLAEPRLVTQSGQEASFLAGGEFPIPVQDDDGVGIEYKEYGVGLVFTPIILSDGKISLRVAPTVSTPISDRAFAFGAGDTPVSYFATSLSTRKLNSTVQLYDGQTLALAGLLQDNIRETVRKVPGLGDIPIIGPLFRSTSYLQEKTDLLVTVTPRIVKPVPEGEIQYPGENMREPNWFEFYLEGRLEGRRPVGEQPALSRYTTSSDRSSDEKAGGFEGEFGHQ